MKNNNFTLYLSLGSNMGNRFKHLKQGLNALKNVIDVEVYSSVYETEPVGSGSQNYLNMVLKAHTTLLPHPLLKKLHEIEAEMGRNRNKEVIWGDRTLDIDILFYEEIMMNDYILTIPHKEINNRIFVLEPLLELIDNPAMLKQLKQLKQKPFHIKKLGPLDPDTDE